MNPYYRPTQGPEEPKSMPYWQQRLEPTQPKSQPAMPINSWLSSRPPFSQAPPPEPPKPKEIPRYPTVATAPPTAPPMPVLPPKLGSSAWLPNLNPKLAAPPKPEEPAAAEVEATPSEIDRSTLAVTDQRSLRTEPEVEIPSKNPWPSAEYTANYSDSKWISLKDLDGISDDDEDEPTDEDSAANELDWSSLTNGRGSNRAEPKLPSPESENGFEPTVAFQVEQAWSPRSFETNFAGSDPAPRDDTASPPRKRRLRRSDRGQASETPSKKNAAQSGEQVRPAAAKPNEPAPLKVSRSEKARNQQAPPDFPIEPRRLEDQPAVRGGRPGGPRFIDFDDEDDEDDVVELREFRDEALVRVRASRMEELEQARNAGSQEPERARGPRPDELQKAAAPRAERPADVRPPERAPQSKVKASREAVLVEDDLVYVLVDDEGRPVLN